MDLFSMALLFLIFLIAIPLVLAVVLRIIQVRAYRKALDEREALEARMQGAAPAAATIVSARQVQDSPAGERLSEQLRVRLTLKVEPPEAEPFTSVVEWFVDPLMQTYLQPGSAVSVKVDARDGRTVYPNLDWARPVPFADD